VSLFKTGMDGMVSDLKVNRLVDAQKFQQVLPKMSLILDL
jgi:hypothetical protein